MAQAYQESQFDQTKRGPRGAVGIMQVLPSTAASKPFGFSGIDKDVNRNVQAGSAILRYLIDVCIPEFCREVQPPASLKGLDIPSRRAVFVPWKPSRRPAFGMGNPTFR